MYLPIQFKSNDLADAVELMRKHSFATLICNDDDGQPFVSYLPLHLDLRRRDDQPLPVLLGHVARANPHWKYLANRGTALVSFLGPHAYMSPTVYTDTMRVPSWNYVSVQCQVQVRLLTERAEMEQMLAKLIEDNEPAYLAQWRSLGDEYQARMMGMIVGFELEVTGLQCKLKLNQHRPESHAALRRAYADGGEAQRELVGWMDRLKM
ncbi:MAG TPA: FMN-binding negative transcriptional regulator [Steroidobacteraceae bacterium]|jgi:transcriptional regulator|nr:FMN-binding negative transcriptional regulator [Steroidobacteraceae bacterium]